MSLSDKIGTSGDLDEKGDFKTYLDIENVREAVRELKEWIDAHRVIVNEEIKDERSLAHCHIVLNAAENVIAEIFGEKLT